MVFRALYSFHVLIKNILFCLKVNTMLLLCFLSSGRRRHFGRDFRELSVPSAVRVREDHGGAVAAVTRDKNETDCVYGHRCMC